jgi:flagellar protein FliS
MMGTIHNQYLEAEVMNADPVKLVRLLYRGAIDAVVLARRHLASGAIRDRSKSIIKAWEILQELTQSLDHGRGGELSQNLANLYTYMQTRLMEANSLQSERPLQEVQDLLTTLLEGWPQGHALPSAPIDEERVSLSYTG